MVLKDDGEAGGRNGREYGDGVEIEKRPSHSTRRQLSWLCFASAQQLNGSGPES